MSFHNYVEVYQLANNYSDSIFVLKQTIIDRETNQELEAFTSYLDAWKHYKDQVVAVE